jgi:hypothetical protein
MADNARQVLGVLSLRFHTHCEIDQKRFAAFRQVKNGLVQLSAHAI